jgi:phage terminase large subunit-like protein
MADAVAHDELVARIHARVNQMVQHSDPVIEAKMRLAILKQQKIEVLRRDFIRRRFQPTPKQRELMRLGAEFRRRAIFAGNRCGKTVAGCAELVYHLTGVYPDWWEGHRFDKPIKAWCASTTKEKTIGGLQEMLMGRPDGIGTGFMPWARMKHWEKMQNVPGGISRVRVRWGELDGEAESILTFKSYEQTRKAFETERVDFILLDEEPPYNIYRECQMRVLGTTHDPGGHILLTFTPLEGMTDVCLSFLEPHDHGNEQLEGFEDVTSQTVYLTASWEDNPHLSKPEIAELIKDTPDHELEARRFGRPSLGAGKIYKIPEDRFLVAPFVCPDSWMHGLGLDHGWEHPSAICTFARDPGTGISYLTSTWKQRETLIPTIASVLRQMGSEWKPVFADPAGRQTRQDAGGRSTFEQYADEGVFLIEADNAVDAGLEEFRQALMSGQLKVMGYDGGAGPNADWFEEYRLYRRNEKGKLVKVRDDAMDASRYGYRHRDEWSPKRQPQGPDWLRGGGSSWKVS